MTHDSNDCASTDITEKHHTDYSRYFDLITSRKVETLIWQVRSNPPLLADHLLFTDALRGACISTIRDNVPPQVTGHDSFGNHLLGHRHGHYFALPSLDNMHIERFVAWFPEGLSIYHVAVLSNVKKLYVRQKGSGPGETLISLDRTGEFRLLLPHMTGPSTEWYSIVPFVPSRHIHKKERLHSFIESDLSNELRVRGFQADISDVSWRPAWSVPALRSESSNHWFRAYHIRLILTSAVKGPLLLGRHAHFGCGLFQVGTLQQ